MPALIPYIYTRVNRGHLVGVSVLMGAGGVLLMVSGCRSVGRGAALRRFLVALCALCGACALNGPPNGILRPEAAPSQARARLSCVAAIFLDKQGHQRQIRKA
jgi:hypothetical protein